MFYKKLLQLHVLSLSGCLVSFGLEWQKVETE